MDYECNTCGACCSHKWSWPIFRPDRSDASSIPIEMQRMDYPLMKTIDCRCVALNGEVGVNTSCGIYDYRPTACRKFVAGSTLCLEARAAKGL